MIDAFWIKTEPATLDPNREAEGERLIFIFYKDFYAYHPGSSDRAFSLYTVFRPSPTTLEIIKEIRNSLTGRQILFDTNPNIQILLDALVDEKCLTEDQVKNFRSPLSCRPQTPKSC